MGEERESISLQNSACIRLHTKSEPTSAHCAAEPSTHSPEYRHHPQTDQRLKEGSTK